MTTDPRTFVETSLLETVNEIQKHVHVVNSLEEESKRVLVRRSSSGSLTSSSPTSKGKSTISRRRSEPNDQHHELMDETDDTRPKASLYLVVDRLMTPGQDTDTESSHSEQEDLAERLARTVASHPVLRTCTEGITVGVSNHKRAAPALEACVEAVSLGAADRRRFAASLAAAAASELDDVATVAASNPQKSLLGIVATVPDELLGLQDATATDAAQGVLQTQVTAEWNGCGDLHTFSKRAHRQWCHHYGVSVQEPRQRFPRRIRRTRQAVARMANRSAQRLRNNAAWNRLVRDIFSDVVAVSLLILYILFHFGGSIMK